MKAWINSVLQDAQCYDYGDYITWRYGSGCESEYNDRKRLGLDTDGHTFPMPAWLERQLHFENVVYVVAMRIRYAWGGLLCKHLGHPESGLRVDEGGPESPWVSWSCDRCGNGGQSWW